MYTCSLAKIGWFLDGENGDEEERMKRLNLICYKSKVDHRFSVHHGFILFLFIFIFFFIHFGFFYW